MKLLKKSNGSLALIALMVLLLQSCKKEDNGSLPTDNITAVYSLVSSSGVCGGAVVGGSYKPGVALDATNTVTLQVSVTKEGAYSLTTSTLNGYSFSGSGTFATMGLHTIALKGTGTPLALGTNTFLITGGSSAACSFTVTVSNNTLSTQPVDNDHLLFGNPSNAAPITDSAGNYLMQKGYYTLSYNRDRGTPNWVSWHLYSQDLGSVSRSDDFRADNTLPAGWYEVPEDAYSSSGFDRGHNVPSGDRTNTLSANQSTFLMTNMIPQAPTLNQTTWARMEDSLRLLVNAGYELYVIMGSYGSGGTGNNGFQTTIHSGRVTVPSNVWKVAVAIPNGNNDTTRVDAATRVIAVNIPNANAVNGNWKTYRTSVDAIEAATGYDLLSRLPVSLQAVVEAKVDNR